MFLIKTAQGRKFRFLWIVLGMVPVLLMGMQAVAATLDTPGFVLRLDDARGRIISLLDKASNHEYIESKPQDCLWLLDFTEDGGGRVTPGDASAYDSRQTDAPAPAIQMTWRDFKLEAAPDLSVRVTVSYDEAQAVSQWDIQIEGLNGMPLTVVRFPHIPGITPQEAESLAVPYWMGEKTTQARDFFSGDGVGRRRDFSYPGLLSLQCITLYREDGPGLYLAADDIEARSKHFSVFGDGQGRLGLEVGHFPNATATAAGSYTPGYQVLLGTYQGDWITAAERYRAWALEQPWARDSRLRRGLTPEWVTDTGFWIWNRGHSAGVLAPAKLFRDYLGTPVSVFWHWWHGCAYDVGFPEYLPPREGAVPFRAAVADARESDIHAIVYMNQRLWGMSAESWETRNAERFAVKGADGAVRPEVYNTFTKSPCASMCMGTSFWRDTYAGLSEAVFNDLGVSGIYMDQACSSLVCYDTNHGHAPGGGTYWMEGFRALEGDIRTRCSGVALAGEGCGEAWLPHLDLMLSLQVSLERYAAPGLWEPIPFFHAVYHGYTTLYGNYASLTRPPYDPLWPAEFAPEQPLQLLDAKFRHQFRLEHARAFVWGQQPCLANFTEEQLVERAGELSYIRNLARLRSQALPYLLHGTFMRPPSAAIPTMEIAVSRLSIYAGQQDAVQEYRKEVPQWMMALWRAEDGSVALAVANIADTAQQIHLDLSAKEQGLPERGILHKLTSEGRTEMARFDGGRATLVDALPAADACIYLFTGE